jgi:tRNA-modifying protein YgfZ
MFSLEQYHAAKERAAIIDRSTQGKIALTGPDRASFLHALLTNDIARLTPGTGTYAAYLTPQGRMISDMRVVESGEEILLDVEPSVVDSLATRLDKLIFSEDLQVRNVTQSLAEVGIHGPASAKLLEGATGIPAARLQSLSQYDNVKAPGFAVTVVRDDAFGMMGFDVYLPAEDARRLVDALTEEGAVRATDETAEVLRLEAGRPRFGVDMDTETIPLEAGIEDRAISLTKGCYVGQEVIVRVLHRGHGRVARRLVRLDVDGDEIPVKNDAILAGEQEIGRITSAAFSPETKRPLALGYVQRDYISEGTPVAVKSGGRLLQARVRQLEKQLGVRRREVQS